MSKAQRYEIQWDEDTRLLAERAAAAAGYANVKAYLTHLVRQDAPKVLSEYAQIKMSLENFERFMTACQTAPAPSARLLKAARTIAAEGIWIETKN